MSDTSFWCSALSVFIFLVAAACVYLFLLNRFLIQIRDGRYKLPIIRGFMLTLGLGATTFGWFAAGTWWMLAPVGVLALMLLGEVRRLIIRRRSRGEPPVAMENVGVSLARRVTTTDLAVLRYRLSLPGWRGPNLRIAHISDLHVNSHLPLDYFRDTMRRVVAAEPDLILYTGDFVTERRFAALLPEILSLAHGRLGTFGVLGNHDVWAGADVVTQAVRSTGVTLLGNDCYRIEAGDGAEILICGYERPWTRARWHAPVLTPGQLALMLTHTPDNIYRLSLLGLQAVFAGHYHAGQMRIPWLGALVIPSYYGRRFDHGHFVVNGTHLFVTAGVGAAMPPRRIYCQPDVFIVDIKGTQVS